MTTKQTQRPRKRRRGIGPDDRVPAGDGHGRAAGPYYCVNPDCRRRVDATDANEHGDRLCARCRLEIYATSDSVRRFDPDDGEET